MPGIVGCSGSRAVHRPLGSGRRRRRGKGRRQPRRQSGPRDSRYSAHDSVAGSPLSGGQGPHAFQRCASVHLAVAIRTFAGSMGSSKPPTIVAPRVPRGRERRCVVATEEPAGQPGLASRLLQNNRLHIPGKAPLDDGPLRQSRYQRALDIGDAQLILTTPRFRAFVTAR